MKTYNLSFTFCDSYGNNATYLTFDKVKLEDISEIIRLMASYTDISNISINKNV